MIGPAVEITLTELHDMGENAMTEKIYTVRHANARVRGLRKPVAVLMPYRYFEEMAREIIRLQRALTNNPLQYAVDVACAVTTEET